MWTTLGVFLCLPSPSPSSNSPHHFPLLPGKSGETEGLRGELVSPSEVPSAGDFGNMASQALFQGISHQKDMGCRGEEEEELLEGKRYQLHHATNLYRVPTGHQVLKVQ